MSRTKQKNEIVETIASTKDVKDRLPDELVDQLLAQCGDVSRATEPGGFINQLVGRFVERATHAEMDEHLGYPMRSARPGESSNCRNGSTQKTIITDTGKVRIEQPRDRAGSFEPKIVPKHERRFKGFDDQILAMYTRGMSVRDIQSHLEEIYHTHISKELITAVTDAVLEDAKEWQTRALEEVYPIIYLDAMVIKIKDGGIVQKCSVYNVVGVNLEGERDVLGTWFQETEGSKFWMRVLNDLKQRGVKDILICCVDGLTGFPEAIEAIYPLTCVQTCIVHQVRNSLKYVSYKERKQVAGDLKQIYTAINQDDAEDKLNTFAEKWDHQYPMISKSWQRDWEQIIPFLAFPQDLRRVVYTTNTIEGLHRQIRKTIKTKGHFPNETAALKLIYLTIKNAQKNWSKTTNNWTGALRALKIHFEDRIPEPPTTC